MAFQSVYRLTFNDSQGYRIQCDLQKDDYAGAVTDFTFQGESPIVIVDQLKDHIYTKGCKLNIINDLDDMFEFANLHKEDQYTYRLNVQQSEAGLNQILLFRGFMIDDVFHQVLQKNQLITLSFNNGLAHLDRFYPAFLEDTDTYYTEQEIIEQCLAFANPEANIFINNTLYEDNMTAAEKADNPFMASYLNKLTFTKDNGDFENAQQILTKILESVNAVVYEKEGHFYIERNIDRDLTSKTWWKYTPGLSDPYSSDVESGITPTNLDPEVLKREVMDYSLIPAAKLIKVLLNYDLFNNLIINYWSNILNYSPSGWLPTVMDRWYYTGDYILVDTLAFSNDFIFHGWQFRKQTAETVEDFTSYAHFAYRTKFTKHPDDETVIKFSFKQWIFQPPYTYLKFRFYIYLDGGVGYRRYAWWDEDAEEWSLEIAPSEINVYVNNEEDVEHEWNCAKDIDLTGLLSAWPDHIDISVIVRVTAYEYDIPYYPWRGWAGVGGAYGDFELKTNVEDPDNLISADLNNAKNKIIEKSLSLFDTLSWNYENSKYIIDINGYHQLTESWTDDTITSETLQRHCITNWGNYFNATRSTFSLEIIKKLIQVDQLFETTLLQDENTDDIKLYVEQMTHDVKKNTFVIKLTEYISDLGKRIGLNP